MIERLEKFFYIVVLLSIAVGVVSIAVMLVTATYQLAFTS